MTSFKASIIGDKVMAIDELRHNILSYFGVPGLKQHQDKMVEIRDSLEVLDSFNQDWLDNGFNDDEKLEKKNYILCLGGQVGLIKKLCRRFPPLARHLNKSLRKHIYNYDKAFGNFHYQIHDQFQKEVCYQIYLLSGDINSF